MGCFMDDMVECAFCNQYFSLLINIICIVQKIDNARSFEIFIRYNGILFTRLEVFRRYVTFNDDGIMYRVSSANFISRIKYSSVSTYMIAEEWEGISLVESSGILP